MSSNSKPGCPSPPDIKQKNEDITRIMNSLGASDKCKSAFSNAVDSSLQKGDAAIVIASPGGIGGGTASFSDSQNKIRENLNKSGCSDVFANVNQQMNSTQSILCEVSNYKNTTSLAGSANASIKIIQGKPTDAMLDVRSKVLSGLVVPTPPTEAIAFIDKDLYKTAYENYMRAMEIHKEEIDNIMGNVTIKNSYFKNTANVDMRVISSMSSIDTTSIAEHFKETAKNAAIQELKNKTGLGANSDSVKSLVANKINNKNQTISDSIKNHLQNVEISIASDSSVLIKFFGALTIDGVRFNQNAQGNLITQNIMTSASNLGKSVALDMLSDAASSTKSDKESGGQAKVLQQLLEGQVALSKANAEGAANMFKGVTGFLGMFAMIPIIIGIVILLFFPQISNVIAPGPLKYVLAAVLMYFVLAWFIGFWPFSKSEKSIFPYDGLAYVMTEHRGDPEGRGPYNWHVDHRWKMQ